MNPISIQLDDFYRFAQERLQSSSTAGSLDDLFESWRISHPTDAESTANLLAIEEALADMKAGDIGVPAEDVIAEMRREFHLESPE